MNILLNRGLGCGGGAEWGAGIEHKVKVQIYSK